MLRNSIEYILNILTGVTTTVGAFGNTAAVGCPSNAFTSTTPLAWDFLNNVMQVQIQCGLPPFTDRFLSAFIPATASFVTGGSVAFSIVPTSTSITLWSGLVMSNNVSSICNNHGQCLDNTTVNSAFTCTCNPGYSGMTCQTDINECASAPCFNGGTCVDGVNSFSCLCVPGFSGVYCQTNINECNSSPCQNGATCVDGINSWTCTCAAGYMNTSCQTFHFSACLVPTLIVSQAERLIFRVHPQTNQAVLWSDLSSQLTALREVRYCPQTSKLWAVGTTVATSRTLLQLDPFTSAVLSTFALATAPAGCSTGSFFASIACDPTPGSDVIYILENTAVNPFCVLTMNSTRMNITAVTSFSTPLSDLVFDFDLTNPSNPILSMISSSLTATAPTFYTMSLATATITTVGVIGNHAIAGCTSSLIANTDMGWDYTNKIMQTLVQCAANPSTSRELIQLNTTGPNWVTGTVVPITVVPTDANPFFGLVLATNDTGLCNQHGTCVDVTTSANNFTCACNPGYSGNTCMTDINECASLPCQNAATCVDGVNSFSCICSSGFSGTLCQTGINDCDSFPCQNGGICSESLGVISCMFTRLQWRLLSDGH